jgi:hypothetical protein
VTADDVIKKTLSPWIFHELATVDTIREKTPDRLSVKTAGSLDESSQESFSLKIGYMLPEKRLAAIDHKLLAQWKTGGKKTAGLALDQLYKLTKK